MILSIANLLANLMRTVPVPTQRNENPESRENDAPRMATTIRLEPQLRAFVERHASTMGLSIQDFITMTLRAVMIASEQPKASELDLMVSRFFDIFSAYEINTSDITTLLPINSLTRSDLEHRDRILNAMNSDFISHIANLFGVSVDWINGSSEYCIDSPKIQRWYKSPDNFARGLLRLKLTKGVNRISVGFVTDEDVGLEILNMARLKGDDFQSVNITPVIICERVLNNIRFTTYEIWQTERWNYFNCRRDLKLMMMVCERSRIPLDGFALPKSKYEQFSRGTILPQIAMKHPRRTWSISDVIWDHSQNPEIEELPVVKKLFNESKLEIWVETLNQHFKVKNIENVIAGSEMPIIE